MGKVTFFSCQFAAGPHGPCATCCHKRETLCGLTRAPLPAAGGCCHWNVELVQGLRQVTPDMVIPLGLWPGEAIAQALERLDAPLAWVNGEPVIDPDSLGLPDTYGVGTEEVEEAYPAGPASDFEGWIW